MRSSFRTNKGVVDLFYPFSGTFYCPSFYEIGTIREEQHDLLPELIRYNFD